MTQVNYDECRSISKFCPKNMKNMENLIWTLNSYFLRNGPQFNLIIYKNNPNNQVPYSREQKHVSVSDMSWPFQIAYEVDF